MANGVTVTSRMLFSDETAYGPYAENSWHFSYNPAVLSPGTADEAAASGRLAIIDFWNEGPLAEADNLSVYLSDALTGEVQFSWVDWEDPENISHDLEPFTLTVGGTSYPTEVATCITFKCDPYGGYNRQSFYNRVYLGPLAIAAGITGGTGGARPKAAFREDVVEAYNALQARLDIIGVDAVRHAVFSPKHQTSALVTSGWIDNAWDTQRRRGLDPDTKTSLTIA